MSQLVNLLNDFPDRISPMLVKELRQGMRAKTFIVMFLGLQVFLAVMLLSAGASSTSDQVGSTISGIIFLFFSLAVLVIQPLRGMNALSSEVKGNTIDMMVLTRLSAWRIVFGKWVAIVSQSALLLSTIIPYLILRYFFGGMNLIGEIVMLLLIFLTSMSLTAVTVGLSGCHSVIVRTLLPILSLPVLMWTLAIMLFSGSRATSFLMDSITLNSSEGRMTVLIYGLALIYLGGSMLSLGASLIAPASENHALARRVVATALLLITLPILPFSNIDADWIVLLISVICIPALIIALTDSSPLVSTVSQSFSKHGPLGRFVGFFLLPTWSSGVLYALAFGVMAVVGMFTIIHFHPNVYNWDGDEAVAILSLFGGMLFPSVWQIFLFKGDGQRLSHYLLLLAGSLIMLLVLTILAESMDGGGFLWAFAWHPMAYLAMLNQSGTGDMALLVGIIAVDLVLIFLLLVAAIQGFRKSVESIDSVSPAEITSHS
jgi:ABC-type transport system involved in multi-copper enzyme maturation permease subunit